MCGARQVEDEEDDAHRRCSHGKINIEAPPPRDVFRERPSQQGPRNARDRKDTAQRTGIDRPFVERDDIDDEDDGTRENACGPQAGNGAAHDKRNRVWSCTTHRRAGFEDAYTAEEYPLGAVEGVQPAKYELEGRARQEIRGAVPADVAERVEVVRDAGDRGCDDGSVLIGESVLSSPTIYGEQKASWFTSATSRVAK